MVKSFFMLVLCYLVLVLPFSFSLSVSSPEVVPAWSSFGFSVFLDSVDSWEKTSVFVDQNIILNVYSNGFVSLDPKTGNNVVKTSLVDSDPFSSSGLILYVVYSGFSPGEHLISAIANSSSGSSKVVSIVPLDQNFSVEVFSALGEHSSKLDNLDFSLSDLNSQLMNLTKKVSVLGQKLEYLEKTEPKNEVVEKNRQGFLSGFFNLVESLFLPLGIVALIFVIAALFMFFKDKLGKGPDKDDFGLPLSKDEEEMASELAGKK